MRHTNDGGAIEMLLLLFGLHPSSLLRGCLFIIGGLPFSVYDDDDYNFEMAELVLILCCVQSQVYHGFSYI